MAINPDKIAKTREDAMSAIVTAEETLKEARRCIEVAGGHRGWNETRQSWLAKAAGRLGITPRRAATLFYEKTTSLRAHELDQMRQRVNAIQQRDEHRRAYINETRTLAQESGGTLAQVAGNIACALEQAADRLEGLTRDD